MRSVAVALPRRPRNPGLDIFRGQAARFALVGATGIAINQVGLWFAADVVGLHYLVAAILASQVSTVWNFGLIEAFVFPGRPSKWAMVKRFIRYDVVNMSTLIIRGPALVIGVDVLGFNYLLVNLVVLIGLFGVRYALADVWIWRQGGEPIVRAAEDLDEPLLADGGRA